MKKLLFCFALVLALTQTSCSSSSDSSNPYPIDTMVSIWQLPESAAALTLELPLPAGFNYDFTVDWGDGTIEEITSTNAQHTYAQGGKYIVKIQGLVEAWDLSNLTSDQRSWLISVPQLGDMGWLSLRNAFADAPNLEWVAGGVTSDVNKLDHTFDGSPIVEMDVSNWDTSNVTSMLWTFHEAKKANPDVSGWDTSKVELMESMFNYADNANPDVSNWDTSSVTSMRRMFQYAKKANPDVSNWKTSNVINMEAVFGLTDNANPDVSEWDTSNVEFMNGMFFDADSTSNLDFSDWDLSSLKNADSIFRYSAVDTETYSQFLIRAAATANENNVNLGADDKNYNATAISARAKLVDDLGWMIDDEGPE